MFDFGAALAKFRAEKLAADNAAIKQRQDEHRLISDLYRKFDAFRGQYSIPVDSQLVEGALEVSKNQNERLRISTYGDQKFDVKIIRAGVVEQISSGAIGLDEAGITDYLVRWAVE